ncbi:MAG: hypothetical protein AB7H81_23645 [Vicinamibacterales bacterium]
MRLMSFALTTAQILDRSKTVTRRLGWRTIQPGTLVQPVKKAQGLKKGESPERIGVPIRILSRTQEPLGRLLEDVDYGFDEVAREGFSQHPLVMGSPARFVEYFRNAQPAKTRPTLTTAVTRLEFEYVAPDAAALVRTLALGLPRWRLPLGDEIRLHHALDQVIRSLLPTELVMPEHRLSRDSRIDFYFPRQRVGLEVKVQGGPGDVARQLERYAEDPAIGYLVLLTGRMRLCNIGHAWRRPVPLTVIPLLGGQL